MHVRMCFLTALLSLVAACNLGSTSLAISDATPMTAPQSTAIQPATTPTPAPVAQSIGPYSYPPDVNPLIGLAAPDPMALERRPVVVKISNAPPLVRPQAGVGAADLVYEHYAEGGLTRFSAIFYSQAPERVGSIRSARLIDLELMPMYKGLLAFSGASIGVETLLNESDFASRLYKGVLYGRPYYWRDESIEVPHNMFTSVAALWELAAEEGYNQRPDLHGMAFLAEPPPTDSTANLIDIRYRATRVRWEFDSAAGLYRRFSDGEPHFDASTQQQVTAANVIILYATHEFTDIVESVWQDSVSYSIEIQLWGEGNATVFRDGQRHDARWVRSSREDVLGLRTLDGELLYLKPGNTWFQVVRPPEQMNPAEEWVNIE